MWGATATGLGEDIYAAFQQGARPIVAIKSARVGDFNGKTLSSVQSSIIRLDPQVPEALALRAW